MHGFTVEVESELGGRWRSLVDPDGYEWLWARQDRARSTVAPGDQFVDVGGAEECFPTIGGYPDHGDVWSRPWTPGDDGLVVESGDSRITRNIDVSGSAVVVDYRLDGPPGTRFVWTLHVSLDPAIGTHIDAPTGHPVRAWPGHVRAIETVWPDVLGIDDYDTLGSDDGSAMFCVLPGLEQLAVRNSRAALRFRLESSDHLVSFGVWRNLGGFPWHGRGTYRNFVVEPMMGRALDRSRAEPNELAVIPSHGRSRWRLLLERASEPTGR